MSFGIRGNPRITIVGLTAIVICACSDQGPSAPPGAVRVTAATSGLDLDADGFTVTLDAKAPPAVATNGTTLLDSLVPGSHSVGLGDLAADSVL